MSERKIFSVDRIEGELAVCISDDDEQVTVPVGTLGGLCVRDVFSAVAQGDALIDIIPMPEERDKRLKRGRSLLHALAKKSKK